MGLYLGSQPISHLTHLRWGVHLSCDSRAARHTLPPPPCTRSPTTWSGDRWQESVTGDRVFMCPAAQVETPFYEEWWFLLVMALSSLIVILLVVFALVLHGQNRRYRSCSTGGTPDLTPLPPTPCLQKCLGTGKPKC